MSETLKRASSAVPWSLMAKVVRFTLSLATSMIVVRMLSAHDYGILAIVRTSVAFFAAVAGAGMGNALIRYLPERETKGAGSKDLIRFCLLIQLCGWVIFVLLVFLARGSIDALYGNRMGTPLLAGVAFLSGNMLFMLIANSLTAMFRTKNLAFLQGFLSAAILVISYMALRAGWGVIGVLGAASIPYLVAGLVFLPRLFRTVSGGVVRPEWRRISRYAVPLAAIEVLNLITWRQSETLLLGHFRSPVEAGIFDIAYRLPQLLLEFVPETIWPVVMAAFVEIYTRDKKRVNEMVAHYFRVLFLLVTPITVFGVLYGDLLIETLYGAGRAASGQYAQIFFFIFHLSFFGTPFSMALYLIEKTWVNLVLAGIFAIVNLGLDFLLIPRYGLPGAIPPVAIAVAISPFLRYWAVRKFHGPVPVPWKFLGKCYLASAPLLLLLPMRSIAGRPAGFLLLLLIAVTIFLVSVRMVRLIGPEERELIERSSLPGRRLLERWLY